MTLLLLTNFILMQEFWILMGGSVALLVSSGTLMIAPYFFGQIINYAITRNEGLFRVVSFNLMNGCYRKYNAAPLYCMDD